MEEAIEKEYRLVPGFRRTDLEYMVKYLNNPAVVQNLREIPVPYTKEDANKYYDYLETHLQSSSQRARLRFTIRDLDEKPIREISIKEEHPCKWIIGYWLGEEYWGKGIMTWACKKSLEAAKQEGIERIIATPKCTNLASRRVLEKCGFKCIRDDTEYFATDGKVHDVAVFEISLK
jgi:[ribosomal protein S5]-alanine N-acetyltransferase